MRVRAGGFSSCGEIAPSVFSIQYSVFSVRHWAFGIEHSALSIEHWALRILSPARGSTPRIEASISWTGWKIGQSMAKLASRRGDLKDAAGIRCRNQIRSHRGDVRRLPCADFRGRLGLNEVVDACAAAADFRLGRCDQPDARDLMQQRTRLEANPLPVRQMTGVVIDDPGLDGVTAGSRFAELDEHLGNVPDTRAERSCPWRPCGIVSKEVTVLLHGRPAAGSIDHNALYRGLLEYLDRASGETSCLFAIARMERQRAAASLSARCVDIAPLGGKHPHGCLVHVIECKPLHTTSQHADFLPKPAFGRRVCPHACEESPHGHCAAPARPTHGFGSISRRSPTMASMRLAAARHRRLPS